jgi:hypothetical protein
MRRENDVGYINKRGQSDRSAPGDRGAAASYLKGKACENKKMRLRRGVASLFPRA